MLGCQPCFSFAHAKAFSNPSWEQQERAIENIITLRKHGWRGVDLKLHLDAATQVEKVAVKSLKKGDWVLEHMEERTRLHAGHRFPPIDLWCTPQRSACQIVGEKAS